MFSVKKFVKWKVFSENSITFVKQNCIKNMVDIVLDWLMDNYPIILLCLAVAFAVWKCARFYYRRFEKTEDTVKKLPCEKHLEEINVLKGSIGKIDSICEQLSEVTRWIMKLDSSEIDQLAPKFSPRKMTKAGLNLYEISGAKAVIEKNADALIEAVHIDNPPTPLDVEDKAYAVLAGRLSDPIFNDMKNFIYFQPEKITLKGDCDSDVTVSLSMALLIRLMSIELRDRYLEKYPING